jgi:hypothetical protein
MAANPFLLPPEEEVFRMRESEKARKAEERERLKHMSVAEKTTFCSRSATKGQRSIAEDRRARPPKVIFYLLPPSFHTEMQSNA